jgi:dihydroflavonol-4-reductase
MFASSGRAERDLGFRIAPVDPALRAAVAWFRAHGYAPATAPTPTPAPTPTSPSTP